MAQPSHPADQAKRTRGRRAGIDLPAILAAAREISARDITVQAVADRLGVDRAAVHHHVKNRQRLLELMAADAFEEQFAVVELSPDMNWRQACRTYAYGFTASLMATGVLAEHFRFENAIVLELLTPNEALLTTLLAAGFDDETAVRALVLLTDLCITLARDRVLTAGGREHPRSLALRNAFESESADRFGNIARISALGLNIDDAGQLDFAIDTFVEGLAARTAIPRQ